MSTARPDRFSAPLGNATAGLLEVLSGASNLSLRAAAPAGYRDAEVLAEGSFVGRIPEVRVDEHRVRLLYGRSLRDFCFDWGGTSAQLGLSALVPWEVRVRGGASCLDADLSRITLAHLEIQGGMSEARVRLPQPTRTVHLVVHGGVSELSLSRPAGVPLAVSIHGGASGLAVDSLVLGAVGGPFHWETPGFAQAEARYVIEIRGGVSDARIGSFADESVGAAWSRAQATASL